MSANVDKLEKCPVCQGKVVLVKENGQQIFRCRKCASEFDTQITENRIHDTTGHIVEVLS